MKIALARLERLFQDFVARGTPDVAAYVVSDARAGVEQRLDVYHQAYRLRLLEALGNDFPNLKRYVGDAEFERIARAYIELHPSTQPSVRGFGKSLARFLDAPELAGAEPVLADIAAFEWARGEAFDAPDAPVLTVKGLAEIPRADWPFLRLRLHPTLRRLSLRWNAPALCKALADDAPVPQPEQSPAEWLVWRHGLEVYWRSLDETEPRALDAAARGARFAGICESLLDVLDADDVPVRAASLLKRWASDGLLAAIASSSDSETGSRP